MFSRLALFLLANFGVLFVLSISMRVLGVDAWLASQGGGLNLNYLLVFAAIMGFVGSFISLAMSKMLAKKSMGVHVIEQPRSEVESWLVNVVKRQADAAGASSVDRVITRSATDSFSRGSPTGVHTPNTWRSN